MKLAALRTLIAAGESLTLELKKSTAEKDRACRTLCAMANGQGGQVAFGVAPAGKVVGQKVGLLRGLGLLVQGDQLSRAAVALFCKDDHAIPEFPQFNLRVARFKGITRDEFLDAKHWPMPLSTATTPAPQARCQSSKPWNPWIAKVFHRRGIIETWGRGTLKIASLMQAAGLPVPTLQERTESVLMTFVLPDAMVRLKKGSAIEKTPGKTPGKTPDLILKWLRAAPGTSIPELAQQLDKSGSAIERAIRKLRAEGKLVRIGPAKGGHWEVIE